MLSRTTSRSSVRFLGLLCNPRVSNSSYLNFGRSVHLFRKSPVSSHLPPFLTSSTSLNGSQSRNFCARNKNDDDNNDDTKKKDKDEIKTEEELAEEEDAKEIQEGSRSTALKPVASPHAFILPATNTVPEEWPRMPVIALSRSPVFPKFIKIIELTEPRLMALIRKKVKLGQPYVGVFLKRDEK